MADTDQISNLSHFARNAPVLPTPFWRRKWFRVSATTLLILLPIIIYVFSAAAESGPQRTTITSGPTSGRHEQVEEELIQWVKNFDVSVTPIQTSGSLENLRLLQLGAVDFAIYQTGTEKRIGSDQFRGLDENDDGKLTLNELPDIERVKKTGWMTLDRDNNGKIDRSEFADLSSVRFVANLYSEVVHILVRPESSIHEASDLRDKRIALGTAESGDYAMGLILLEHLGIEKSVTIRQLTYKQMERALGTDPNELPADETVDVAILSAGLLSPHIDDLIKNTGCRIIPVPHVDALVTRQVLLTPAVIPAGLYRGHGEQEYAPQANIKTVAARAQLLVHESVDPRLVNQVTRIVLSDLFQQKMQLKELYSQDTVQRRQFAQNRPEFPIHSGSRMLYDPSEFDAGMFEGWEALYSLIASFLIGMFVLTRWIVRRREKIRGHRLDEYLAELLDIEQRQLKLDCGERDDTHLLQILLDEVTVLRQQALGEFSAHDLNDDPAQALFLQMCHYISEKINAKLLRQRLDHRFEELRDTLRPAVEDDEVRG